MFISESNQRSIDCFSKQLLKITFNINTEHNERNSLRKSLSSKSLVYQKLWLLLLMKTAQKQLRDSKLNFRLLKS